MLKYSDMQERLGQKGFTVLGSGLYATVYAHPVNREIAIKVTKSIDQWPDYVAWATREGFAGNHAPKVHNLKVMDGWYMAVMERLVDTINSVKYIHPMVNHPLREIDTYRLDETGDPELTEFVHAMGAAGFYGDMHGGNVMFRKDGTIVVTDPSSSSSCSKPRIRRGQLVSP